MFRDAIEDVAHRVSHWNRSRKWHLFLNEVRPGPQTTVLDVGFQDAQYQAADNFIESHYEWPAMITALGIEEPEHFSQRYPEVKTVVYDGRDYPFADQEFDVVWSNAVVEHVGDRDAQVRFLREARRVGRRVFLTTPNRGFPIEVHTRLPFLHWLPKPVFDSLLERLGMGQFAGDYMRLLRSRDLRELLAEAGYDLAETRIVRNRLGGPTLDFVVIA
jgi:SAM-dependent methyltransferase